MNKPKDTTISLQDAMTLPHRFFQQTYGPKCVCGHGKNAPIHGRVSNGR